jgi:hypothetical protein
VLQLGASTCDHPRSGFARPTHASPLDFGLRSRLDVGSTWLVAWDLRPSSSDAVSLQKHKKYLPANEGLICTLRQSEPNSWGLLLLPFNVMPSIHPNNSPSKTRFNPNEPNLRSCGEFALKASLPRVGVESSPGLCLSVQAVFRQW